MLRIRKFGENSCGYNAALWNCRSVLRGYATMSFRQGYAYDPSLTVRDALPFNPLMRNFKRNSVFYERERRAFDRIELNSRSAKRGDSRRLRRSRRKDEGGNCKTLPARTRGTRVPTESGGIGRVTRPA